MRCEIPVHLDLRKLPGADAVVLVEGDFPLLAAHAGAAEPAAYTAALPDGRQLPAQHVPAAEGPPRLAVSLPAETAARDEIRLVVQAAQPSPARVVFSQGPESVEIRVDGLPAATYRYNTADPELPRPYFHPLVGPTGQVMTQDGEIPDTKQAHFHHTGLVLAHQNFTDGNNWQIGPSFSRMRHLAFDVMESGPLLGRFVQRLKWPSAKGDRVVFTERRTVTIPHRGTGVRVLDVDTTITCGDRPAVWNATPYHLLAIRVPDAMTVERGGKITPSEGEVNPKGGVRAKWLDFSGNLGGACGVTLMDHPANPRHPTPWLNFENETVGAAPSYHEPLAWQPGEARRFRYRVFLHAGDVMGGKVAEEYAAYVAAVPAVIHAPRPVA